MLMYITIALAIFLAVLDVLAYRRLVSNNASKIWRVVFSVFAITANITPLSVPLFMFIMKNVDNGEIMMKISMFILTIFIIFTLCRLVLYVFWLPYKRKRWLYTGAVASISVLIFILYGVFVTRTNYKITETEVFYKNLPVEFDGYRLAFISDIHVGTMCDACGELKRLSELISEANTDIVLYGGDLVNLHYSELTNERLELLSLIRGKEQTLAVLGNHDTGYYIKDKINNEYNLHKDSVESIINRIGWNVLRDSTVYIYRNCDSIAITGIDYTDEMLKYKHSFKHTENYNPVPVYAGVDKDVFNITISHLPQLWNVICNGGYSDLMLSGHIHAMQLKFNILDISLSPSALLYKEWSGLYENENGKLYINDGIGSVGFFARFGARPEISIITLKCK